MWEENIECPFCNSTKKETTFDGLGPVHGHGYNKIGAYSDYSCCCGNCKKWFSVIYQYHERFNNDKDKLLKYDKYIEFTKDNKKCKKYIKKQG